VALYHLRPDRLQKLGRTTFPELGIRERGDLQRIIRDFPQVLGGDLLILAEEFGDWQDSSRRIDLLALDNNGRLVVVELKREGAGFADLQAIRYAAMVANMTLDRVREAFDSYLRSRGKSESAEELLLDFLPPTEDAEITVRSETPRIILVAADFSRELTTSVLWLNDIGLDIRCIELNPYEINGEYIIDATQVIPVPKADERIVRIRERTEEVSRPKHPTIAWSAVDIDKLKMEVTNPTVRTLLIFARQLQMSVSRSRPYFTPQAEHGSRPEGTWLASRCLPRAGLVERIGPSTSIGMLAATTRRITGCRTTSRAGGEATA
jgi:hypothetical protein